MIAKSNIRQVFLSNKPYSLLLDVSLTDEVAMSIRIPHLFIITCRLCLCLGRDIGFRELMCYLDNSSLVCSSLAKLEYPFSCQYYY